MHANLTVPHADAESQAPRPSNFELCDDSSAGASEGSKLGAGAPSFSCATATAQEAALLHALQRRCHDFAGDGHHQNDNGTMLGLTATMPSSSDRLSSASSLTGSYRSRFVVCCSAKAECRTVTACGIACAIVSASTSHAGAPSQGRQPRRRRA